MIFSLPLEGLDLGFRVPILGFGVPYFNTVVLKGTIMKQKSILFSPWLLKSPDNP